MHPILFRNISLFDGSGALPYPAEILVQGNRVKAVAKGSEKIAAEGATIVDGGGATLMPGLVEPHSHLSYIDCASVLEIGDLPIEEHMFRTARNAKTMLDTGFTSCFSAASAKPRIDIVIRNEINAGNIPGPRYRAASPEIVATGGLGDVRLLARERHSTEIIADGADAVRTAARTMIREGVDTIKLNLSGENWVKPGFSEVLTYSEAEIAAAAHEAHEYGVKLACHSHGKRSIMMALKYGFHALYHCEYADEEALDAMEAKKNEIFVAPTVGSSYTYTYEASKWGVTTEAAAANGMLVTLERGADTMRKLKKRGVRVLPGGDYGFVWNPIGTNARDLEHFVKLFGFAPADVLVAATKFGGEMMGMGGELGLVKEGYLADLLLVDGDPVKDITILQKRDKLLMVMKDGQYHKAPSAGARKRAAAE
jgi:imidazolonepropionase-like amidohydrolase